MPYIFKEVLDENEEEAEVYSIEDYGKAIKERDEARTQRDELIEKADKLQSDYESLREKYAKRFVEAASGSKKEEPKAKEEIDYGIQSFEEIWS